MKPFLSQLGIASDRQSVAPTALDFPPAFNVNNRLIWAEAVEGIKAIQAAQAWGEAIRDYVRLCVTRGVFPFSATRQSVNDLIYQKLLHARRSVVKFMNLSKIMDHVKFQKTDRSVEMTQTGFVVKVYGRATVQDPTFKEWLLQMPYPAFNVKSSGRYTKTLDRGVTFCVYNEYAAGTSRWYVGYEIDCSMFPEIPGHHLASRGELEAFVLDVLWMPVLKSHRPYRYHRRLI